MQIYKIRITIMTNQNNDYYEMINNHPHPEQILPFIECLNTETFTWLKRQAGFPEDWDAVQVSSWLGPVYDRILFRINRDDSYIEPIMYLETIYDNSVLENDVNYYCVMVPMYGFNQEYMRHMYISMLNIDITSTVQWTDYIHRGGRDRFMIRIRRYEPHLPHNIFSNYH